MQHLCIKYRNQKHNSATSILEQTFIDIPAGTEEEKRCIQKLSMIIFVTMIG